MKTTRITHIIFSNIIMLPFMILKFISFIVFTITISILALFTALIRWNCENIYTQFKAHLKDEYNLLKSYK